MSKGEDHPCITGNVLKDREAKLNEDEIKSICLTMVAASLDTVPGNLIMGIACQQGQEIQKRVYEDIMRTYPDGDAWEKCLTEEKVAYVTALIKEILRFWTVVPRGLPRTNIKDIKWEEATIPAGTTFFMNAWAADYDPTHLKDPTSFLPERYLDSEEGTGTPYYAFGAGSRMCAGSHLANRELYTAFVRLISAFYILPPKKKEDEPILDSLECNLNKDTLTTDPKKFKAGFKVRNGEALKKWIATSEKRAEHIWHN